MALHNSVMLAKGGATTLVGVAEWLSRLSFRTATTRYHDVYPASSVVC